MRTSAFGAFVSSLLLLFSGVSFSQTPASAPKAAHHAKSSPSPLKWAKAKTFTCAPATGLMTSWNGQPGRPDHQDTGTINPHSYMACRAVSAPNTQPDPACFVIFQHDTPYTIPSRHAILGPNHGDGITLSCNGTAPTCCQIQMWPSLKEALKAEKEGKNQ